MQNPREKLRAKIERKGELIAEYSATARSLDGKSDPASRAARKYYANRCERFREELAALDAQLTALG